MDSEAARHLVEYTVPVAELGRSAPSNRGMAELEDAMGALSAQAPIAVVHGVGQRGEVRQATLSEAVAQTGSAFASGTPVGATRLCGGRPKGRNIFLTFTMEHAHYCHIAAEMVSKSGCSASLAGSSPTKGFGILMCENRCVAM